MGARRAGEGGAVRGEDQDGEVLARPKRELILAGRRLKVEQRARRDPVLRGPAESAHDSVKRLSKASW